MTNKQIMDDALLHAGISGYNTDDPTVVGYINRAVEIISIKYNEVGKKKTVTYVIDASNVSTWLDLPSDFLAERRTYTDYENSTLQYADKAPNEYLIENEQIRYDNQGIYTIEYVAIPDEVVNISQTPSINKLYHAGISYYVAARIKAEVFGDEEGEKQYLLAQFEKYIDEVFGRLNRRKRRRSVKAPQWG